MEGEKKAKESEKKDEKKEDEGEKKDDEKEFKEQSFNCYGQATVITQWHDAFHSPYQGPNSFLSEEETKTSLTTTLMLGGRLWQGGGLYFDPEIACGYGPRIPGY